MKIVKIISYRSTDNLVGASSLLNRVLKIGDISLCYSIVLNAVRKTTQKIEGLNPSSSDISLLESEGFSIELV